jgi:hypothetical protein
VKGGADQVFVISHPYGPEQPPSYCGVRREYQIEDLLPLRRLLDFKSNNRSLQLDMETVISGVHYKWTGQYRITDASSFEDKYQGIVYLSFL